MRKQKKTCSVCGNAHRMPLRNIYAFLKGNDSLRDSLKRIILFTTRKKAEAFGAPPDYQMVHMRADIESHPEVISVDPESGADEIVEAIIEPQGVAYEKIVSAMDGQCAYQKEHPEEWAKLSAEERAFEIEHDGQIVDATGDLQIEVGRLADGTPTMKIAGSTQAPLVFQGKTKRGGLIFGQPAN